jgi:GxxExxY protein
MSAGERAGKRRRSDCDGAAREVRDCVASVCARVAAAEYPHEVAAAARRVYRPALGGLGPGHSETVYRNALALELRALGDCVLTEAVEPIVYRGVNVGFCRADVVVVRPNAGCTVLELKQTLSLSRGGAAEALKWRVQARKYKDYFRARESLLVVFGREDATVTGV